MKAAAPPQHRAGSALVAPGALVLRQGCWERLVLLRLDPLALT